MEMWQKYIEKTKATEPILKAYLELRRLFQSYGWSESDLNNPPFYSRQMMMLRDEIGDKIRKLKNEIKDLGLDSKENDIADYLRPFLHKIDELTPLNYGNNERRNQGDEDIE